MPSIENLYQQMKDRRDVLVLTMTSDSRPRLGRLGNFSFPVLYSASFVRDHVGSTPIPRHWVLDRDLVLRFDRVGGLSTGVIEDEIEKAGAKGKGNADVQHQQPE